MRQKILIIDDCKMVHSVLRSHLADEPVELFSAHDGPSGLAMAQNSAPDLILLDIEMPGMTGFEVCQQLKADNSTSGIPVVFLSSLTCTEDKIRGLDMGAVDYVTKPFEPAELKARVRASLRTKFLLDLLGKKAMIDGLTGLWNRAYLDKRLAQEASLARRHETALSCILLDVDHFKKLNDRWGHTFGDTVLRSLAQVMIGLARPEDVVCRYGGEEFAVLTPAVAMGGATCLAERLRRGVEELSLPHRGEVVRVTCSFGVADMSVAEAGTILQTADEALYRAKGAGRNRVVCAPKSPSQALQAAG
jgi:diguanylate cyclase (GGDEF)-like protein